MDSANHAQHIPDDEGSEVNASSGQVQYSLISLLAGLLSSQPAYWQRQNRFTPSHFP